MDLLAEQQGLMRWGGEFLGVSINQTGSRSAYDSVLLALSGSGWTAKDLVRNELPGGSSWQVRHRIFWLTIRDLSRLLRQIQVSPIIIKCLREYQYADSNVDLLVPRSQFKIVVEQICRSAWRLPGPGSRLEQSLMEPGKLKLPALDEPLLPAHIYTDISWRYQQGTRLLLLENDGPDEEQLQRVPLRGHLPESLCEPDEWVYHPNETSELVIQAAHIVFENFRMTLGEAVNFVFLLQRSNRSAALRLADQHGYRKALELVASESMNILENLVMLDPKDFPRPLRLVDVLPCFRARYGRLWHARHRVKGLIELGSSVSFYAGLQAIRKVRRWRRGHEDYSATRSDGL